MTEQELDQLAESIKHLLFENAEVVSLSDDELYHRIEELVAQRAGQRYMSIQNRIDAVQRTYQSIRGLGLLDELLRDESITEIMINGPDHIFIERQGEVSRLDKRFESARRLEDIVQRIVGQAGREVNQANPIVDTRLPDGSRVNVVLPPVSLVGPVVTIRKFSKTPMTIEQLIKYGSITPDIAEVLKMLVRAKYNIFVSGGTGSGKTTFLNALSNFIPKNERIITIEDSAELQLKQVEDLVVLEARNANTSGAGAITIRDLIKASLRMRPERIIVGEVRGAEALDMLQEGDVLIIDGNGCMERSQCGEIMSTYAYKKGCAGIVVDGVIRDLEGIRKLPIPVYARGVQANGPLKNGLGEIGVPVPIGGIVIYPGDIIVSDADGLLAISPYEAEELAKKARATFEGETKLLEQILATGVWNRKVFHDAINNSGLELIDAEYRYI